MDQDRLRKLAGLEQVQESLHKENPDNPKNPQVYVHGGGVTTLDNLTKNIQKKLLELSEAAAKAKDLEDWKEVWWMMDHAWMRSATKAIVDALKELEDKK